jgi:hypothetical protein
MEVQKPGKGTVAVPVERIARAILLIRGHKVILDEELSGSEGPEAAIS